LTGFPPLPEPHPKKEKGFTTARCSTARAQQPALTTNRTEEDENQDIHDCLHDRRRDRVQLDRFRRNLLEGLRLLREEGRSEESFVLLDQNGRETRAWWPGR
jgi:hypothetical protein